MGPFRGPHEDYQLATGHGLGASVGALDPRLQQKATYIRLGRARNNGELSQLYEWISGEATCAFIGAARKGS